MPYPFTPTIIWFIFGFAVLFAATKAIWDALVRAAEQDREEQRAKEENERKRQQADEAARARKELEQRGEEERSQRQARNWLQDLARHVDDPERMTNRLLAFYSVTDLDISPYYVARGFPKDASLPDLTLPQNLVGLKVLPAESGASPAVCRQFLEALRAACHPVSFTVLSRNDTLAFHFRLAPSDRELVERQIQIHFPDFATEEVDPAPVSLEWSQRLSGLSGSALFKGLGAFALDPYRQLFAALEATHGRSITSCYEVVFSPADELVGAVIEAVSSSVDLHEVTSHRYFFDHQVEWMSQEERYGRLLNHLNAHCNRYIHPSEEAMRGIVQDLSKKRPAWWVSVRLSASDGAPLKRLQEEFLKQYETVDQGWAENPRDPLDADLPDPCAGDLCLGTEELAGLVHFPAKGTVCDSLERVSMKTKRPPELMLGGEGILLGVNEWLRTRSDVRLPASVRDRHLYIVGKTRTGKSTLLFNLALQDIQSGSGVAVIDPHGDLVEELLRHIPADRVRDTIYFNASDREHPIALNVLDAESDLEAGLLAEDLLVTFRRLSENWGERMENILRYTFHTLLGSPGTTLLDVPALLQNQTYRERLLSRITTRPLREFWRDQFPALPKDATQPILSRMGKFVLSETLSGILGQKQSRLNFFDLIQTRKVLLVNLSHGKIGGDTATLLGSLIVSQIQLAIMRRANIDQEKREPFYLYIDEFQNFTTSAFDKILSEAGKYKLCLTLAHQFISQLDDRVKNAILGNVGTIAAFTLWPNDATALRHELGGFSAEDLANIAKYHALVRPPTKSADTFLMTTLPPPARPERSFASEVIEQTGRLYSTGYRPEPTAVRAAEEQAQYRSAIAPAAAKDALPARERILYYVNLAEYLSTSQVVELCYGHLAEPSRAPSASRDLRALVGTKELKEEPFGRAKVYFTGRTCRPTTHNLAVRDLFVKILRSGFEVSEVSFTRDLGGVRPDLYTLLPLPTRKLRTLWEYDTGTEGVRELLDKVERYQVIPDYDLLILVAGDEARRAQLHKALPTVPRLATTTMQDCDALYRAGFYEAGDDEAIPFFALKEAGGRIVTE